MSLRSIKAEIKLLQPKKGDLLILRVQPGDQTDIMQIAQELQKLDSLNGTQLIIVNHDIDIQHYNEEKMASIGWFRKSG